MTGAPQSSANRISAAIQFSINIAVLLGAYGFEILGGLAPCQLCYYQRAPYFLAILVCGVVWLRPAWTRNISALLILIYFSSAALGLYHAGVEWKFWPGPASCTAMGGYNLSVEELMAQILAAPVVRCDEIPWSLFGISLAGYNALVSMGLLVAAAGTFMQAIRIRNNGHV